MFNIKYLVNDVSYHNIIVRHGFLKQTQILIGARITVRRDDRRDNSIISQKIIRIMCISLDHKIRLDGNVVCPDDNFLNIVTILIIILWECVSRIFEFERWLKTT